MERQNCMMMWGRILWLTTDFWLYSGTNKRQKTLNATSNGCGLDTLAYCIHERMWAPVVWAKYFLKKSRLENTSQSLAVTLVAEFPAAALCLSVTGRSTEKSRQPIYKVGTDTLHHSPRVVQFWHQSLITIFGEGADWLHLLDASRSWQTLCPKILNTMRMCPNFMKAY